MEEIKKEFWFAIIFIGKWLAIGLGGLGILYFAINLAYHKLYYDPRMDKFDFEIAKLQEHKGELKIDRKNLVFILDENKEEIIKLRVNDLKTAKNNTLKARKKINKLDISKWKIAPLRSKDEKEAFQNLKARENEEHIIIAKINSHVDKEDKNNKKLKNIIKDISRLEEDIKDEIFKKEKAQVGVKGPMFWVWSALVLAF